MMERRTFLSGAVTAAFAASGSALAQTAARPEAGIQVFSFLPSGANWEQYSAGLARLREIGFDGVQLAGFAGQRPEAIRRRADELGLSVRSMHIGNDQLTAFTPDPPPPGQPAPAPGLGERTGFQNAATATYTPLGIVQIARVMLPRARDAGIQWGMIGHSGWENLATLENIKRWCDAMNEANVIARRVGVGLSYHSHDLDFRKVEGQTPFDIMIAGTDPTIKMELDIGWCVSGGGDPVAVINRYHSRLTSLHLRDLRNGERVPIGTGDTIDWPALMAASRQIVDLKYYAEHSGGAQAEANAATTLRFMRERLGLGRRAA